MVNPLFFSFCSAAAVPKFSIKEQFPCVPPHCPTAGTPVVPLVPLVRSLRRLGYVISESCRYPCLACGDRSPTGEGRDRAGPSCRYEVRVLQPLLHCTQEKWWVTTDLGSASFESEPSQATVQDAHAETHFRVRPSPRLVCSDRPEGRVLSCLDSSSTQAVSALCVRGSSISVQGPTLRAGPVSPRLHESRGGSPCSHERTGRPHPQLSRRLAHSRSVSETILRTQGFGAQSPQPVGPSGQLGKEQTRPSAEDLFSRYGVGFGRTVSTPHRGTCSVGVELPEYMQGQDSGPTETFSEAPGAYGGRSGSNPARLASYETASALASWPSPEMGVATRHVPSGNHSGMPPNLQPVVRPLVSSGRSSPRAGVPACCSLHGCLCHWLGGHVQRAGSVRGVDGPPTGLAHQLPRVASSIPCPGPPEGAVTGKACAGPYGQYCGRCIHQPSRRSALPSRVATRPPSPPLESEASEVASRHSCPCVLNRVAEDLSRAALPGEWQLHPQVVQLIWGEFGEAQVDLFASLGTSHCQLFYSLSEGTLGTDALAHSWPRGLRKYAFPPVSLLAQTLCKVREDEERVLLVAPYWPNRTWFPELMLLATAPPWLVPLRKDLLSQRRGTIWHPRPDLWKLHVWSLDGTRRY